MPKMTNEWALLNEIMAKCQRIQQEVERAGGYAHITLIANGQTLAITQDLAEVPYRFVEALNLDKADEPLLLE
ncbi:MAG: hypothetical protein DYG88_07360 [Chloroflexi bacterium CFX4]|nr:hypothetical protein [Chloroflexi bacterium CFX4]MDL1921968.1 hypothetical protein [Chloroflexi bacterium CFX3]